MATSNANPTKPMEGTAADDREDASLMRAIEAKMKSMRSAARAYDADGYQTSDFLVHGDKKD
jgi:hypothetical protein